MTEKITTMLDGLDMTKAESEVYLTLLKNGSVSAGEISKVSGYSRTKVYEILEKLVKIGLAESFPARPVKYNAFDPEIAIPSYISSKRDELRKLEDNLTALLKEQYKKIPSKESEIFINQGLRKSSLKYCQLVKNARNEIYSFLGWVSKNEIDNIIDAYGTAKKTGVEIKLAYFENELFKEQADIKNEGTLSKMATHFYPVPSATFWIKNPAARVLIVDDHSILITLGDYLEDGTMKDVISVHYYNVPAFSTVAKKIAASYFESMFGGNR